MKQAELKKLLHEYNGICGLYNLFFILDLSGYLSEVVALVTVLPITGKKAIVENPF
ncbi:hypothetical protein [Snodgrassella alvi]|uniref:hypothetical protein n=1 Tax=Snodgrassella alvi TaxID=1196083 RepID=UPI0012FD0B48|nr:hypothetical protein [Snodgrassella alvi]